MDDMEAAIAAVDLGVHRQVFCVIAQDCDHGGGNKAITEIRNDHHIEIAYIPLNPAANLVFGFPQHRILAVEIHLEQLGEIDVDKRRLVTVGAS